MLYGAVEHKQKPQRDSVLTAAPSHPFGTLEIVDWKIWNWNGFVKDGSELKNMDLYERGCS